MSEKAELVVECKESVAFQMASHIASMEEMYKDKASYRKKFLDLYAECLEAAWHQRDIKGQ